jgi:phospholipid/cholesterol/gamma-HCH transport system substrate-binding protein
MQKRAPTLGNILVIIAFVLSCFGLLLFMWETFGGSVPLKSKGYRFEATFPRTLALAEQSEVTISGVDVGHVISLKTDPEGTTHVVAEIDSRYAPLRRSDRLMIRQKTILGETYMQVIPGSSSAPALPDEGVIPQASVEPVVTLDGLLETFSPKVRHAFRTWMISSAEGVEGRGEQINAGLAELQPFIEDTHRLLDALAPQQEAVSTLIHDTGTVFDALTEREHQLRELIVQGDKAFGPASAASSQFAQAWRELPGFERGSERVFTSINKLMNTDDPVLVELRPVERALTPLVRELGTFAPPFNDLLTAFGPLTTAAEKGLPALSKSLKLTKPVLGHFPPVLHNFNPFLQYTDEYLPELRAFFANFTAASQGHLGSTNAPTRVKTRLHYLRSMQYVGPESLAVLPSRFGTSRSNAYQHPGVFSSLAAGLPVFESSTCSGSGPTVEGPANEYVTQEVIEELISNKVANAPSSSGNDVGAPPCNKQQPFTFNGKTSEFPHVIESE